MTPELYPPVIRNTGHQMATASCRTFAFFTPYVAVLLSVHQVWLRRTPC